MSRIGKLPINIPESVDINYSGSELTVKGKFGTLQTIIPDTIFGKHNPFTRHEDRLAAPSASVLLHTLHDHTR